MNTAGGPVQRKDIVLQPDDTGLTNEMMKRFRDGLPV